MLSIVKKMHKKLDTKSLVAMLGFKTEWQLDKIYRVMNNYTVGELESLLMFLCDVDLKIKTGRISNKLALEMFIMELCK